MGYIINIQSIWNLKNHNNHYYIFLGDKNHGLGFVDLEYIVDILCCLFAHQIFCILLC